MKRLIVLLAATAALLAPSAALASGVVLKVQRANHLVAIARTPSSVALVHTSAHLVVGQRVALQARKLHNGTLAASSIKVLGRAHKVTFRGLLLAKSGSRFVISAGGAVIAVHRGGRTTASARDSGPKPGSTVQVTATVGKTGELDEDDVTTVSPTAPGGRIEGQLTLGTGTITVSSEDMSLVLKVPTGFDLTSFVSGSEVLATFTQGTDGSLTLTALSGDENAQQADDDGGGDNGDNGDGGGGGGGGDSGD
ncbi:MAG TPA: hypothetical protein VH108_01700 [Gaiellaceae bacterium]|jgi:hypothetical protein|nr:hypothetical protein [Gaiellaceae bacterium]